MSQHAKFSVFYIPVYEATVSGWVGMWHGTYTPHKPRTLIERSHRLAYVVCVRLREGTYCALETGE